MYGPPLITSEQDPAAEPGLLDWFHVVGLVHDLGKMLAQFPQAECREPQWAVVGDSFPMGCAFSNQIVHHDSFCANPDSQHPVYSTRLGVYARGCGLQNVTMSWGHDEYLYRVCRRSGCTLPPMALAVIRFHSFYSWHQHGAYNYLMDDEDRDVLEWVRRFQRFDLYSKSERAFSYNEMHQLQRHYQVMLQRYFPRPLKWCC